MTVVYTQHARHYTLDQLKADHAPLDAGRDQLKADPDQLEAGLDC